mgnify:FL=1
MTRIEKVVLVFFVAIVFTGLGYAWRMYHENLNKKTGILITHSEEVQWSISEIKNDYYSTVRQQRYTARDKEGNIVLLIKSPPMEVWVGKWK